MLQTLRLHFSRPRFSATPTVYVSRGLAKRLKELRTRNNLTQEQLATRFGIDHAFISDLERGRPAIPLAAVPEGRRAATDTFTWATHK